MAHPAEVPPEERNAVVAVYDSEDALSGAVRHLEDAGYDTGKLSVLGRGMTEERHVVGFDTRARRTGRWAGWGALWGSVFGALLFVPGVGHVAVGGYLLWLATTGALGAAGGALGGLLSSLGIPPDGIPVYEADLKADKFLVIAHGTEGDVEQARKLLEEGSRPERLEVHHAAGGPFAAASPQ
jgi:hypothetical protein